MTKIEHFRTLSHHGISHVLYHSTQGYFSFQKSICRGLFSRVKLASKIRFWSKFLIRIWTKIADSNYWEVDQNRILIWAKLRITCQNAVLVYFSIIRISDFGQFKHFSGLKTPRNFYPDIVSIINLLPILCRLGIPSQYGPYNKEIMSQNLSLTSTG